MDFTFQAVFLIPAGLGLLGFIEPCTIGGHLFFLDTQKNRSRAEKINAVLVFIGVRSVMAGMFGAFIAFLGQKLIDMQTGIWLIFGVIYLGAGLLFLSGKANLLKKRIDFAPATWKQAQNPVLMGLAFGLNIPACAAPVLFGLLGLAATTGTIFSGFAMMFIFGFFLSSPLLIFAIIPALAGRLDRMAHKLGKMRRFTGVIFVALGIWSIWFGLYVDPANWAGL